MWCCRFLRYLGTVLVQFLMLHGAVSSCSWRMRTCQKSAVARQFLEQLWCISAATVLWRHPSSFFKLMSSSLCRPLASGYKHLDSTSYCRRLLHLPACAAPPPFSFLRPAARILGILLRASLNIFARRPEVVSCRMALKSPASDLRRLSRSAVRWLCQC